MYSVELEEYGSLEVLTLANVMDPYNCQTWAFRYSAARSPIGHSEMKRRN
jgi:hypothetical protein